MPSRLPRRSSSRHAPSPTRRAAWRKVTSSRSRCRPRPAPATASSVSAVPRVDVPAGRRRGCSTRSSRRTARCCPPSGRRLPRSRSHRSSRRSSGSRCWPIAAPRYGSSSPAEGGVNLTAGGDDEGRAEEQLEVVYDGEPITIAFNATFLLDGLGALDTPSARLLFPSANKPTVLRPAESDEEYYYLIMPMRLPR